MSHQGTPEPSAGKLWHVRAEGSAHKVDVSAKAETSSEATAEAWVHAGIAGETFIVNLPGSPSGVMDGLSVLAPILTHICDQLEGSHAHH